MARDLQQTGRLRDNDDEAIEPVQIRRFRRLVSLLMVVMMVGILAIAAALVWKLTQSDARAPVAAIAGDIEIAEGFEALSVSRAGPALYLLLRDTASGAQIIEERRASDRSLVARFKLTPITED